MVPNWRAADRKYISCCIGNMTIYTRPIAEAAKVGFEMPRLQMLESELLFLSQDGVSS